MTQKSVYIIGSLRNEKVPQVGNLLRDNGYDAFDDWYGAGPEADDKWRDYEAIRGRSYRDALYGYAAKTVFNFDRTHLDRCDCAVLVLPAGKSGHLELGYFLGTGKPGFVLFDGCEPKLPEQWLWLTALYEGEGTLTRNGNTNAHGMQLSITMRDKDVLEKAYSIAKVGTLEGPYVRSNPKWSPMYRWAVRRREDILYVLKGMYEHLGARRKEQIATVLTNAGLSLQHVESSSGPQEFRWDVMYQFANDVFFSTDELLEGLNGVA